MIRKILLTLVLTAVGHLAQSAARSLPRWGDGFWRDSVPESMRASYIAFGNEFRGKDWKSLPAAAFAEFKRSGNRSGYEQLMFSKRRQLAALVMAEIIEGKGRFTPDIVNGLMSTLEETWWGLPAHYKTPLPREEDQTVDLFNAETAALVAYTRYMMAEELDRFSPLLTRRIDREVARRILQPAVKTNYWWKKAAMNWNPWICSNWLACVLFCETDSARRAEAIRQVSECCRAFASAYPDDGGCDEGAHYWDRAAASLFETQYLLSTIAGAENGESPSACQLPVANSQLSKMAAYIYKMYIGNGYAVNFADAHGCRAMLNVNISYPFGVAIGDATMRRYAAWVASQEDLTHQAARLYDRSGNWPSLPRELLMLTHIRQLLDERPEEPLLRHVWLPNLEIMTARGEGIYVAVKGGNNGESHNHNDVGSFIVYAAPKGLNGVDGRETQSAPLCPLIIDPGVGEYTSKTFSKQRYDIWTMQSGYHNLPMPNGVMQRDGKEYAARVVSHKDGLLTLDMARAYPKEAQVEQWLRTVTVRKKRIEVTEDFRLGACVAPTQIVLMTPVKPTVQKGSVLLAGHSIGFNPSQLEARTEDVSHLMDATLRAMWGDHLYRIILTVKSDRLKTKLKYCIQ